MTHLAYSAHLMPLQAFQIPRTTMQKTVSGYPSNEVATHPIDCPFIIWFTGSCSVAAFAISSLRNSEFPWSSWSYASAEFKSLMPLIMKLRGFHSGFSDILMRFLGRVDHRDGRGCHFCGLCPLQNTRAILISVCILHTFGLFSGSFYGGGGCIQSQGGGAAGSNLPVSHVATTGT